MPKPSLTFFCELDTPALQEIFAQSKVIKDLQALEANISLGLLDLSPERAAIVKKLTKSGIPVTAWILLPKEEGYWTNLDNIQQTMQQYNRFKEWKDKHSLSFAAVGLDIEPKLDLVANLSKNPFSQIPVLFKRLFNTKSNAIYEIESRYLVDKIRSEGHAVETYQFPTVADERTAKSNFLTKTFGLPILDADREVLMLYSSFFSNYSDSILWSYAQHADAVGVGSTGGGVMIEGVEPLRTLRWIELKRDLLLASQKVRHLYIFSLEGCVGNNYMDRLVNLDWEIGVIPPERSALGITLIRRIAHVILWMLSHPMSLLGFAFAGVFLIKKIRKL